MKRRGMLIFTIIALVFVLTLSLLVTHSDAAESYSIRVNYEQNVVTIYKDGTPIKAMICSTGTATPHSGTYNLDNKYRWLSLVGGVYGQYCTRIVGNILFHSVPYFINGDGGSLEWWEYDKLGTKASAGCIRLQCIDAKWIYDNIPAGTPVTFYADSNPGPLGKPDSLHISNMIDYYRCWDPTDPSSSNTWKNFKDVTFDAKYYADKYPDLKAAFGDNEIQLRNHWYDRGIGESRQASPVFNSRFYLSYYGDLQKAFGFDLYRVYEHFLMNGIKEQRVSSESFNIKAYKSNYKDLQKAFGNDLVAYYDHFNKYGIPEKRIASIDFNTLKVAFDPIYYADNNPDAKEECGTNTEQLYYYFINTGVSQKQVAAYTFDAEYYLDNNTDLQKAFGKTAYKEAFDHFIHFGINENRKSSPNFDVMIYKENYKDLRNAFGNNVKLYYLHYVNNGVNENRVTNMTLEEAEKKAKEEAEEKAKQEELNNTISNTTNSVVNNTVGNFVVENLIGN